jgi:DNA-binding transcriptional regulator YdaS (Cro superfamily)
MILIDYIQQRGGTGTLSCPVVAQLATASKCATTTLYMIAHGHKSAGPRLARRIELATGGAVNRAVLRPDYFGKQIDS